MRVENQQGLVYLLVDSRFKYLAHGQLSARLEDGKLRFVITDGRISAVEDADSIQIVPEDTARTPKPAHFISREGNTVVLEPVEHQSRRQDLRVPVSFDTFLYPKEGGRISVRSRDLSCGGLAFYSPRLFQARDRFEIVIPITSEGPLLLTGEVLRVLPHELGPTLHLCASRFLDMCNDEEAKIREAVYHYDVHSGS